MTIRLNALAALMSCLPALPAHAAAASNLDFRGIEGCDSPAAFEEKVSSRGITLETALDTGTRLFVRVSFVGEPRATGNEETAASGGASDEEDGGTSGGEEGLSEDYQGAIWLEGPDGATERREVRADSCAEVLSALGMVAAIALQQEEEEMDDAVEEAPPLEPSEETAEDYERHRFSGSSKWDREEIEVPAGKLRFDPLTSMSIGYGAAWGPFPAVSHGIDFSVELANGFTSPSGEQHIIGPMLKLRGGLSGTYSRFALGACATPYFNLNGFAIIACADFGFAHFTDTSAGSDSELEFTERTMGTVGGTLELRYNFAKHWQVGASIGYDALLGSVPTGSSENSSFKWKGSLRYSLTMGYHF